MVNLLPSSRGFSIQERMVLFWHDYFAIQAKDVRRPQLMYIQNALLRKHTLEMISFTLGGFLARAYGRAKAIGPLAASALSSAKTPSSILPELPPRTIRISFRPTPPQSERLPHTLISRKSGNPLKRVRNLSPFPISRPSTGRVKSTPPGGFRSTCT